MNFDDKDFDFDFKFDFMDKIIMPLLLCGFLISLIFRSFLPNVIWDNIKKKSKNFLIWSIWSILLIGIPVYYFSIRETLYNNFFVYDFEFYIPLIMFCVVMGIVTLVLFNYFPLEIDWDAIKQKLKKILKWILWASWPATLIGVPIYYYHIQETLPEPYIVLCMFSLLGVAIILLSWDQRKVNAYSDNYNYSNNRSINTSTYTPFNSEKRRNGGLTDKQLILRKKQIREKLDGNIKLTKKEKIFNKLKIKT